MGTVGEANPLSASTVRSRGWIIIAVVLLLLIGLPIAVWLDLHNLTETTLQLQAGGLNSVISSVRAYYANNVVGRVLASPGSAQVVHDYQNIPGAIPLPATLSIELGQIISDKQANITYRFISDYPFKTRAPHIFDDFEQNALTQLRLQPKQQITDISGSLLSRRVRLVGPVVMDAVCVKCHNAHPNSPKRDWKVGDVRGIQEVIVTQPIAPNVFAFKYLLMFSLVMGTAGGAFIVLQWRQGLVISKINHKLEAANEYLRTIT